MWVTNTNRTNVKESISCEITGAAWLPILLNNHGPSGYHIISTRILLSSSANNFLLIIKLNYKIWLDNLWRIKL